MMAQDALPRFVVRKKEGAFSEVAAFTDAKGSAFSRFVKREWVRKAR